MSNRLIFLIITIFVLSLAAVILIFYFNGRTVKEYYDDGALKAVYSYRKGEIEGRYIEYYPNGEIKLKARFVNGVQVDTLKAYFDNGTLKELSYLRNGKKDGLYTDFYSNGKRKSIGWARDGYKDSLFTYYSKSEEIDSIVLYRKGKIEIRAIFERGQVSYQDFRYNYSLKFPQNWEFDLSQKAAVLLLKNGEGKKLGDFTESLNIMFYQHNPSMSIKEFTSSYLVSMKQDIPSFRMSSINYTDNNRCDIRYTATYGERNLEAYVRIVYGRNDAYMITCTADENNFKMVKDVFELMSISFDQIVNQEQENLITA